MALNFSQIAIGPGGQPITKPSEKKKGIQPAPTEGKFWWETNKKDDFSNIGISPATGGSTVATDVLKKYYAGLGSKPVNLPNVTGGGSAPVPMPEVKGEGSTPVKMPDPMEKYVLEHYGPEVYQKTYGKKPPGAALTPAVFKKGTETAMITEPATPGMGALAPAVTPTTPTAPVIPPTPKTKTMAEKLAEASAAAEGYDPTARRAALTEEAGMAGKKEVLTKYEKEEQDTLTLLDNLEKDIVERTGGYLVSEAERRRITAAEEAPLMKKLGITQRGKAAISGEVERGETEVERLLGLEKEKAEAPLDRLQKEANILNTIKKDKEVELDTFTDEKGDRVATLWDQDTGKTRQVILGKAEKKKRETEQTTAGGRRLLIDSTTGDTIKDLGPATDETKVSDPEQYDTIKMEAVQLFNQWIQQEKTRAAKEGRAYDEMIDPELYEAVRNRVPASYRDKFDEKFKHLLSIESMDRFAID